MTKQKFYELVVLKTYQRHALDLNELQTLDQNNIDEDIIVEAQKIKAAFGKFPKTFNELKMKRAILGFDPALFPDKQPFDEFGFAYIAQLFGFVRECEDYEFQQVFFSLLHDCPTLIDWKDEKQAGFVCGLYIDTLTGDSINGSWLEDLFHLIYAHIEEAHDSVPDLVADIISLVQAFGFCKDSEEYFGLNKYRKMWNL